MSESQLDWFGLIFLVFVGFATVPILYRGNGTRPLAACMLAFVGVLAWAKADGFAHDATWGMHVRTNLLTAIVFVCTWWAAFRHHK